MAARPLASFRHLVDRAMAYPELGTAVRSVVALLTPLWLSAAGVLGPGRLVPLDPIFVAIPAQGLSMVSIRGPYPVRLAFLMVMALLLTGLAAVGGLAGGYAVAAVLATGLIALNAGLWRHLTPEYGPSLAAPAGFVFFLAMARQDPGPHAASVLVGALFAVVLHAVAWPFRAQHPLRQAVGDAWLAASKLVSTVAREHVDACGETPDRQAADPIGAEEAALRAAVDAADATLAAVGRDRPLVPQLSAAVRSAARLGLRATALHTAAEGLACRSDAAAVDAALRVALEPVGRTAGDVALAIISRQPAHLAAAGVRVRRAAGLLSAFRDLVLAGAPAGPAEAAAARHVVPLVDLLHEQLEDTLLAAAAVTDRAGERAVFRLELADADTWNLRPFAAALNLRAKPEAVLVRYTLRLAAMLMLGVLAIRLFPLPHGYWLPFTMLIVSQTDYGATRKRAAERFGGTLVGAALGSALMFVPLPHAAVLALVGLNVFLFALLLRRNYAVAVVFVTLMVVMLTELGQKADVTLAAERLGSTAVGGAVALVAAMAFWPAWERDRLPPVLAAAVRAVAAYAAAVGARFAAGGTYTPDDVAAKRAAEKATAAALTSLGRMYADPANRLDGVERAAAVANGLQRFGRLLNLMLVRAGTPAAAGEAAAVQTFVGHAGRVLAEVAEAVESPAADVPAIDERPTADLPSGGAPSVALLARARAEVDAIAHALRDSRAPSRAVPQRVPEARDVQHAGF